MWATAYKETTATGPQLRLSFGGSPASWSSLARAPSKRCFGLCLSPASSCRVPPDRLLEVTPGLTHDVPPLLPRYVKNIAPLCRSHHVQRAPSAVLSHNLSRLFFPGGKWGNALVHRCPRTLPSDILALYGLISVSVGWDGHTMVSVKSSGFCSTISASSGRVDVG